MMIVPFEAAHLRLMMVQPAQVQTLGFVKESDLEMIEKKTQAFTAIADDEILACAGVIEYYPGRGEGWSYLSANIKHHMVPVVRAIKTYIQDSNVRRIEITVDADFEQGHRMAKLLGLELEAPRMRAYDLAGRDRALYARIKEHV